MAREKSDIEYQVVTVRFPKEIYQEYKKILKTEGKIPTYDLRNYIFSVVEEYEKGQRWVQKKSALFQKSLVVLLVFVR